jgi:hypothetical protein
MCLSKTETPFRASYPGRKASSNRGLYLLRSSLVMAWPQLALTTTLLIKVWWGITSQLMTSKNTGVKQLTLKITHRKDESYSLKRLPANTSWCNISPSICSFSTWIRCSHLWRSLRRHLWTQESSKTRRGNFKNRFRCLIKQSKD